MVSLTGVVRIDECDAAIKCIDLQVHAQNLPSSFDRYFLLSLSWFALNAARVSKAMR
jgi:hypothetical protein